MHAPRWGRRRWLLIIALAAPVVGLLGVTIAELVPDGRIGSHLVNAMNRGEITAEDRTASLLGTTADHYAECVAVMNGLGDQPGTLVKRALYSSTSYGCVGTIETLERFGASGEFPTQPNYMRYWHGYSVFTRPALAIFGLSGTRWLAFATLGLSIVAFARSVFTRFGVVPMVVVLVPGLLTTDMIVGGWSIAQALGLASAWVGGWIVLTQASAERSWQVIALAAALGGAINAYFDLMVAIPASLALCAVGAGLATLPAERRVDLAVIRSMAVAVCGWAVGLAAMWFAKWAFAWLFVDRQAIVDSVTDQISFRTSGAHDSVTGTRFNGFWKNVDFWLDRPLTPLVARRNGGHPRRRDVAPSPPPQLAGAGVDRRSAGRRRRSGDRLVHGPQQPQPDPLLAHVSIGGYRLRCRGDGRNRRRHNLRRRTARRSVRSTQRR